MVAVTQNSTSTGNLARFSAPEPNGVQVDGFATLPEGPSIDVDETFVAPFSLPQEALSFEPSPEVLVCSFKNGDTERKIYNNTKLRDPELENLQKLRKEAEGKAFLPSISVMAARYLNQSRGDRDKALKAMLESQKWKLTYFANPMSTEKVAKDLEMGILYFIGRDQCLRPTLMFRGNRIPAQWLKEKQYERITDLFIFCMEYFLRFMIVPGRVEGMNILVDLKGLTFAQIPVTALERIYKTVGSHYCGRTFKFYVVNMPFSLRVLVGVAKGIISERQAMKLTVLSNPQELLKEFAPHQLEMDLGGTRPLLKEFFPFPLLQGPFSPGHKDGPSSDRVPNVHRALTLQGARGRLWDTALSSEDNTKLEYSEEATEILKRCGLPVSAHCTAADEHAVAERCFPPLSDFTVVSSKFESRFSQSMNQITEKSREIDSSITGKKDTEADKDCRAIVQGLIHKRVVWHPDSMLKNWWFFVCQKHVILGIAFCHKWHPYTRPERVLAWLAVVISSLGISLFLLALLSGAPLSEGTIQCFALAISCYLATKAVFMHSLVTHKAVQDDSVLQTSASVIHKEEEIINDCKKAGCGTFFLWLISLSWLVAGLASSLGKSLSAGVVVQEFLCSQLYAWVLELAIITVQFLLGWYGILISAPEGTGGDDVKQDMKDKYPEGIEYPKNKSTLWDNDRSQCKGCWKEAPQTADGHDEEGARDNEGYFTCEEV